MPNIDTLLQRLRTAAPVTLKQRFLDLVKGSPDPTTNPEHGQMTILFRYLNGLTDLSLGQRNAIQRVENFVNNRRPLGGFSRFHRELIAFQLAVRILAPTAIHQKNTQTCATAAFAYDMCMNNPDDYVAAVIDLAEAGNTTLSNLAIAPRENVKDRMPNELLGLTEADWVFLVSLRDAMSGGPWQYGMQFFKEIWDFGVTPGQLFEVLVKVGYSKVLLFGVSGLTGALTNVWSTQVHAPNDQVLVSQMNKVSYSTENALMMAKGLLKTGWKVFLFGNNVIGTAVTASHIATQIPDANMRAPVQQRAVETLSKSEENHCMLLLELDLKKSTEWHVSCKLVNRGGIVEGSELPLDKFGKHVQSIVAATA